MLLSHFLQGLNMDIMEEFVAKEVETMSSNRTAEPEVDEAR